MTVHLFEIDRVHMRDVLSSVSGEHQTVHREKLPQILAAGSLVDHRHASFALREEFSRRCRGKKRAETLFIFSENVPPPLSLSLSVFLSSSLVFSLSP